MHSLSMRHCFLREELENEGLSHVIPCQDTTSCFHVRRQPLTMLQCFVIISSTSTNKNPEEYIAWFNSFWVVYHMLRKS